MLRELFLMMITPLKHFLCYPKLDFALIYTIWNNYMLRELFFNNDRSIIFTIVFPKIGFHININTSNTIWNILSISEFFKCHWTIFSHNHKKIGHILHNMEKIDCSIEFKMVLHHP